MSDYRANVKIPLEVLSSLEGESGHRPIATVLAVPREIRRSALRTIFQKLDIETCSRCKDVTRNIGHLMFDYRRLSDLRALRLSPQKRRKWYRDVHSASSKLLSLLADEGAISEKLPQNFRYTDDFLQTLVRLNAHAKIQDREFGLEVPGSRPDLATKRLINSLAHMYREETGKEPKLSLYHDHSDDKKSKKHGQPIGPFYEIVHAMFNLLGESKSPQAIATAIKKREDMGKTVKI